MEAPRRRWIPVTFLIWLGLFALAAELNSDRPNMGDPRLVASVVMATSEAQGIAEAAMERSAARSTSTLVDEHHAPPIPNPGPQKSREILQVTLLHLAVQLDWLAQACDASSTRNAQQRLCVRDAPLHGGARAEISRCARQGQCAAVDARSRELRGIRDRTRKEQPMEHASRWVGSGSCNGGICLRASRRRNPQARDPIQVRKPTHLSG